MKTIQLWLSYISDVLKFCATMLEQWPKMPEDLKRKPAKPKTNEQKG